MSRSRDETSPIFTSPSPARALSFEPGRARACQNFHWAYFESELFTNEIFETRARACFELFWKLGFSSLEPGAYLLRAKIRPGPSSLSPGSFHLYLVLGLETSCIGGKWAQETFLSSRKKNFDVRVRSWNSFLSSCSCSYVVEVAHASVTAGAVFTAIVVGTIVFVAVALLKLMLMLCLG